MASVLAVTGSVAVPFAEWGALSGYAATGLICTVGPKLAKQLKKPCKNAIMAAALGASVCGNHAETLGKAPGSARSYARDRERIEEVNQRANQKSPSHKTGTIPD